MKPEVLQRFIVLMAVATVAMFSVWAVLEHYLQAPPGDYQVRQGDILLSDGKHEDAIERFNAALAVAPNHRGALMGRAIALLQSGRHGEAEAEFTALIALLTATLAADDPTGRAVLAGAYANRGILYDRAGRYQEALADYRRALAIDAGAIGGPGLGHKILYGNARPATVEKRARYLEQQLALPEDRRRMRDPEMDDRQRMYKP